MPCLALVVKTLATPGWKAAAPSIRRMDLWEKDCWDRYEIKTAGAEKPVIIFIICMTNLS